jgi:glycosyltransferase involved in cell wall biosynthesis
LYRFLQSAYVANQARRLRHRHLHSHYANFVATVSFFASWMTMIPYSFTAHAWDIYKRKVDPKQLTQNIAKARFVVTVSEFNKTYLERFADGATNKIVRIYNGIDLETFIPNGTPPRTPWTLLCVARLVEKKGLTIFIEACRRLRDRQIPLRGWIVGTGQLQDRLQTQITQGRLDDQVHLLGAHTQRELLKRYHAAHLFVLPCIVGSDGDRDGLPVSMVEALACGVPVVTTPMTGNPEVIRPYHNGLLVPIRDPQALSDAIEAVYRNPALYERLRANARPSVKSAFDLRQTVAQLDVCFQCGGA